ncbi:MAG: nicotinate (nicotinamide) nucleotide adenylyltransferase [Henriciella sp.]|nr:nicotinate (nicotinamide) nucleotide adenylyltransferase [Henriciella sp.]
MLHIRSDALLPPSSTRARIGMFGGSFDPPHSGHLHVASTAMKRLQLDAVWWFPTPGNPLKEAPSDYEERFAAVQVLTKRNRDFRVSNIEKQAGLRYTYDLVRLMRQHCPHADLVWIMGGDSLMTFHYWKDWEKLAESIPIAVIARPGFELASRFSLFAKKMRRHRLANNAASILPQQKAPAWVYVPAPLDPISSTALRTG